MKNIKKFLALGLAAVMTMSLAACGDTTTTTDPTGTGNGVTDGGNAGGGTTGGGTTATGGDGCIDIGCWWVQYYDSDDAIEDAPDWQSAQPADDDSEERKEQKAISLQVAETKFANVKAIEERYGTKFLWQNLTYEGVRESINTSIMAGSPDCEIYLVEAQLGVPAQANGLAVDLKTVLPADDDLFTTQSNMGYLDLGDGKACILYQQAGEATVAGTYPLGFNMQMLEENGLEDPRELYKRGEWTWDKFNEYCQVLTQDTDGDGQIDQYGYCGYENETLEQLMMSNGANIASGTTEALSSAATGEALQQMYDMYNTYKVCYPYDYEGTPSDSMRVQYTQGNIGFFPIAVWIANSNKDYGDANNLTFDTAYVRWPVGPSGNAATNPGKNAVSGMTFYIISAGCPDPAQAYHVLADFFNWYGGDVSVRDNKANLNWWYNENARIEELKDQNYDVMFEAGANSTVDFWLSLGVQWDVMSLIKGEVTPAQFQETYKQQVQDGLDAYFAH